MEHVNGKKGQTEITKYERMLNSIHAAVYTIHVKDHHLQFLNLELEKMLPDVHKGEVCYQALFNSDTPCEFCPIHKVMDSRQPAHMELFNEKLNRYLSLDVVDITEDEDDPMVLFTGYDITRLVESETRLKELAFTDALTNVKNRGAFFGQLTTQYEEKTSGCICLLNIKNLKRYNLLYGKKEGDKLLIKVASRFSAKYSSDKIFRIDGAKLAFLAVGDDECKELHDYIKQTEKELLDTWKNPNFKLSFDTAFVCYPDCAKTPEELVYNGEYLIGKCGKLSAGSSLEFDFNEQYMLNRRNRIEEILRYDDYSYNFKVYFQPIYDISTNSFSKCEALLRLFDEELGMVSPVEFIAIAEDSGYIGKIGNFVLHEVCSLLANRMRLGLPLNQVNVNVSSIEFGCVGFSQRVIATTQQWGISPQFIQFEITESIFINSMNYVVDIMNELISYGFSFAIDDFGTGYSNLSYIGTMPFKSLKLDKSFMDMMLLSDSYKLIITNVIEIAKGLNLSVVAEGIESSEQYEMIKQLGTNFIQGFLFSKPLSRFDYEVFLEEHA